jgi:hypothetical protein
VFPALKRLVEQGEVPGKPAILAWFFGENTVIVLAVDMTDRGRGGVVFWEKCRYIGHRKALLGLFAKHSWVCHPLKGICLQYFLAARVFTALAVSFTLHRTVVKGPTCLASPTDRRY